MTSNSTHQTTAKIQTYLQTLAGRNDLEGLLNDYDDNAVFYTPDCVYRGKSEIRGFFNSFLNSMPAAVRDAFQVMWQDISEDTAHIVWKADPFIPLGTDTIVVKNGKITMQTFSTHVLS